MERPNTLDPDIDVEGSVRKGLTVDMGGRSYELEKVKAPSNHDYPVSESASTSTSCLL